MSETYVITAEGRDAQSLLGPGIRAILDQAIANAPPEGRGAVELRATLEGVEADAAVKLRENLTAGAFWQWRKGHGQTLGARIRFTF